MDPQIEANIAIRAATLSDAEAVAHIGVDTWRSTYRGIVPDQVLAKLSYERSTQNWMRQITEPITNQVFLVATVPDHGVVGYAMGGAERDGTPNFDCEIYALYINAAFQKQGIGRKLMTQCARKFIADHFSAMLIWVLRDNLTGRKFYETMGGVPITEKQITIGGHPLQETAYGWSDLSQFST